MSKPMLLHDLTGVDGALSGIHVAALSCKCGVSEQAMSIGLARLDFVAYT